MEAAPIDLWIRLEWPDLGNPSALSLTREDLELKRDAARTKATIAKARGETDVDYWIGRAAAYAELLDLLERVEQLSRGRH